MLEHLRLWRRIVRRAVARGDCVHLEHLGLGDHIVGNAITRDLCRRNPFVWMPVKAHNQASVAFMFRDLKNLGLVPVTDGREAGRATRMMMARGCWRSGLGAYGDPPFDPTCFDREFYRQAGLPFEERWSGFHLQRDLSSEIPPPSEPYAFVHDDPTRGYVIDRHRIGAGLPIITNLTFRVSTLFELGRLIEGAAEVHCINSSLMHWIEHLKPVGKLFWHYYARSDETLMTLRQSWTRLDG